jgi:hypothetical protein
VEADGVFGGADGQSEALAFYVAVEGWGAAGLALLPVAFL